MKKIFSSIMTLAVALALTACGGNTNSGDREAPRLLQKRLTMALI